MRGYVKPAVDLTEDYAEGVYAASGSIVAENGAVEESSSAAEDYGSPKCDSIYMNGVWQAPDYSAWGPEGRGYKAQYGCLGCPSYTWNGCGLGTEHYGNSGNAASYDVDNGNRKPDWEKQGHLPDETVTF